MILNNIHHIRRALSEMPERLDLERCYRWLEEAKEGTGTSLRELISTVLASADDDIDNKMEEVVGGITKRVREGGGREGGVAVSIVIALL